MALARKIAPYVASALTSTRVRGWRRSAVELARRLSGRPHLVRYFHQVDDPYSHLAAQTLERFCKRYDVELAPRLVGPPADSAAPERGRLENFARKDAADVAPYHQLTMPRRDAPPNADQIARANRILTAALQRGALVEAASTVGAALWTNDSAAMNEAAVQYGEASANAAAEALGVGESERERLGHYWGATFHYGGEWYWGIDRLSYLEQRLTDLGARRADLASGPLISRKLPDHTNVASPERITVDFFFSARSPYSYIALAPTFELAQRLPIEVVLRPVLPMVMRGLAVPRVKKFYILMDSKREADRLGIPFGHVCDPVGRPVERVYSLVPFARARGCDKELLLAFTTAAWAEGIDTGTDAGMKSVVERAGLRFDEASPHLDRDDGWRAEVEANRAELLDLGLWGVPSFRVRGRDGEPDFCTWGQDRLWLLETEIRRRLSS